MFKELFELARASGPLTMAVSADTPPGQMTVVVIPKAGDAKDEPALATPLSLTATPEEFDADFNTVLASYRGQRQSLAEQVAATNEVLAAAREAAVQKGSKAATKALAKPKPSSSSVTASMAGDERDEDDDDGDDATQTPSITAGSATPLTDAPAKAGAPDLFG
jgi:PRTRC genetic system protein E